MELMQRRRELMAMTANKSRLPPVYQEVKYIKTPGPWGEDQPIQVESFICTDVIISSAKKIVCKYKVLSYTRVTAKVFPIFITTNYVGQTSPQVPYAGVAGVSGFSSISPTASYPFVGIENEYTILHNSSADRQLRIGGWSDFYWTAEGAYYYVYVYGENDTEVAKFIPCYRILDNKAGMYELISGTFYPSNGTKDFIAGPNV